MRGQPDLYGRALRVTETGFADEIAAAASLLMGAGRRGATRRPGARTELERRGHDGRRPGALRRRGSVPLTSRRIPDARGRTLGRRRRRQARARLEPRAARPANSSWSPTPATTSSISACRSRPTRHADVRARRPRRHRSAAGAGATKPGPSWRRSRRSAARPGSSSATAISPPMSSARDGCAAGETLSAITADFCGRLGIATRVAADDRRPRPHAACVPRRAGSTSRIISCAGAASRR